MTFSPHLRLTWSGTLPNGEVWSNQVALVPDNSAWTTALANSSAALFLTNLIQDVNMTDDLVADVVAYHGRATSHIHNLAVLKRVVLATIGADGKYIASPREAAVNTPGGAADASLPYQIARKVTLETDSDLGRVKGGFYQPMPNGIGWDATTNLWSVAVITDVRNSVKTFLDALNNAPGLDDNSFKVVIASQGRHNKNGTVRQGPGNHEVKRVNVGRRPDVIRRRANHISEARFADVTLEP